MRSILQKVLEDVVFPQLEIRALGYEKMADEVHGNISNEFIVFKSMAEALRGIKVDFEGYLKALSEVEPVKE